jgi:hypothetical protein
MKDINIYIERSNLGLIHKNGEEQIEEFSMKDINLYI